MSTAANTKPQPFPKNKRFVNHIGKRFGKYVVISHLGKINGNRRWLCRCDCGSERVVDGGRLLSGRSKSCGCAIPEIISKLFKTHGLTNSTTYFSWCSMKERCLNKNCESYPRYGGRGITICTRWLNSFENFFADMGEKPKATSLERKDNGVNYEPSNCIWATAKQQANNRRSSRFITYSNITKTLKQWSDSTGLSDDNIAARIKAGWSLKKTFTAPVRPMRRAVARPA